MNNIYLIYGSNYGLIKKEIDKLIRDNTNCEVVKYDLSLDKIDLILDEASCMSMFDDKKILIGENSLFLTTEGSSVNHNINYLEKYLNNEVHDNIIILTVIANKLDERKKIVKLLKEKSIVIQKEEIDSKNIASFIIKEFKSEGYEIDNKTANYFKDYVGIDIDIILSEIKKMIIYKDNDKVITKDDVNEISSKAYKDNILEFCDAIMKKNFNKIHECYSDLTYLKVEPTKIISTIGNQFLLVYQCKLLSNKGKNQGDIASILNVHPYRVKLALETDYMIYELEDILKKLHDIDYKIKSGVSDKNIELESFLLNL